MRLIENYLETNYLLTFEGLIYPSFINRDGREADRSTWNYFDDISVIIERLPSNQKTYFVSQLNSELQTELRFTGEDYREFEVYFKPYYKRYCDFIKSLHEYSNNQSQVRNNKGINDLISEKRVKNPLSIIENLTRRIRIIYRHLTLESDNNHAKYIKDSYLNLEPEWFVGPVQKVMNVWLDSIEKYYPMEIVASLQTIYDIDNGLYMKSKTDSITKINELLNDCIQLEEDSLQRFEPSINWAIRDVCVSIKRINNSIASFHPSIKVTDTKHDSVIKSNSINKETGVNTKNKEQENTEQELNECLMAAFDPKEKPIELKPEAVEPLFEILKYYFRAEERPLLKELLTKGSNARQRLLFNGNGNQLTDAFRELFDAKLIICSKKNVIKNWIKTNFEYVNKGKVIQYTDNTIDAALSKKFTRCKNPIIKIDEGKITPYNNK